MRYCVDDKDTGLREMVEAIFAVFIIIEECFVKVAKRLGSDGLTLTCWTVLNRLTVI